MAVHSRREVHGNNAVANMMLNRIKIVLATFLLLASAIGIAGGTESPVVHVVLVWLKDPGNAAHRARIVEATRAFAGLPGVEEIRVGEPVPSARASVDDSFDIGLYMVFSSREALEAYLDHPDHRAAQREILRPLATKAIVYDFRDDGG